MGFIAYPFNISGIEEAPMDGHLYYRQDGMWVDMTTVGLATEGGDSIVTEDGKKIMPE